MSHEGRASAGRLRICNRVKAARSVTGNQSGTRGKAEAESFEHHFEKMDFYSECSGLF